MSESGANTLRLVRAPTQIVDPWKYYFYKAKNCKQVLVALVELVIVNCLYSQLMSNFGVEPSYPYGNTCILL